MGIELRILGMRKIKDEELNELTGKTRVEIEESEFFRRYYDIDRLCYYEVFVQQEVEEPEYKHIIPILTPLKDAEGQTIYVCWMEELAYYWRKNPKDFVRVEKFWEEMCEKVDWDQAYKRVHYRDVENYICDDPVTDDENEEILVISYG